MKASQKIRIFIVLWLLAVSASSCVLPASRQLSAGQMEAPPFRPPTLVPTALPTAAALASTPEIPNTSATVTSQPGPCEDRLTFVTDVTIPDGTTVLPSARIDKAWEVENNGTCDWGSKYRLKLIEGQSMGAKTEQALLPVAKGSRGTVHIIFTAPKDPGSYRSAWQAVRPDGQLFGDPIYIMIVVSASTPAASPTP